jgi:hypothetical protein
LAIPIPDPGAPAKTDIDSTLDMFEVLQPVDIPGQDIDVALLHFKDPDFIVKLRKSWIIVLTSLQSPRSGDAC